MIARPDIPLAAPFIALTLAGMALPVGAAVPVDPFDGRWHLSLTPYLWLPNINGRSEVPASDVRDPLGRLLHEATLSTEVGPNDYLEHLQFALMLTGEVRKGGWSAFTDIIGIDFGNQDTQARRLTGPGGRALSTIDRSTRTNLSMMLWTVAGAYTVVRAPTWHLDVFAGVRYLGLNSDLKWSLEGSRDILAASGRVSQDTTNWDGLIGVKGQIRLGDGRWFIPYYADIGTGNSQLTWQILAGVGYAFDWGDASLAIRSLSYELDRHDADLRLTGPTLGVSVRW
jgi:hypothetical protein